MPRKKPSSHSDEQFASFKRTSGLEDIDHARFAAMVRGLVRTDANESRMIVAAGPMIADVGTVLRAGRSSFVEGACCIDGLWDEPTDKAEPPALLPLIRQLGLQWSNSEHLLVRILALMLDIDAAAAAVVFSTLGTPHLRLDLVRRLALVKVGDGRTQSELGRIIDDFDEASRVRHELIRDMFTVSHEQDLPESDVVDQQQVAAIVVASDDLSRIGRALEEMIPRVKWAMQNAELQAAAN